MFERGRVVATVITAAVSAGGGYLLRGTSEPGAPNNILSHTLSSTLHVGNPGWLVGEDTGAMEGYDEGYSDADDMCVTSFGAQLVITRGGVEYKDPQAGGAECADGTIIGISAKQAKKQERQYEAYEKQKKKIVDQVKDMDTSKGEPIRIKAGWVDEVNPSSLSADQVEDSDNPDRPVYGSSCRTAGRVYRIGRLSTGESVMVVKDPDWVESTCPPGAIFLDPSPGNIDVY